MAARAAASRLAAAFAASWAARAGGKLLATVTGAYGLYKAGEHALTETVPYAAAAVPGGGGGEGRQRFAPPSWLASMLPEELQAKDTAAKLGLPPLKPGEVKLYNLPRDAPLWQQQLVQDSAQVVLAALQQEARSRPDGFGRHILEQGVHVIFRNGDTAAAAHPNVVLLPPTIISDFTKLAKGDMQLVVTTLQHEFVLAHEMAHLYLRHTAEETWKGEENAVVWATVVQLCRQLRELLLSGDPDIWPGWLALRVFVVRYDNMPPGGPHDRGENGRGTANAYQETASRLKELSWRREFEADEVACALLARLRVPAEQWAAAMRMIRVQELADLEGWIAEVETTGKAEGQDAEKAAAAEVAAVAARAGFPSAAAWIAQLRAALAKGDLAWLEQQRDLWNAYTRWQLLAGVAEEDRSKLGLHVGKSLVLANVIVGPGPGTCPEHAVLALLADMADTHPPTDTRIARIQHLAAQLPMLQRATAPPVEMGGQFYAGSVAQLVADRAAAGMQASAAQQAVRDAQQSAQHQSRQAAQQAAWQQAAAGMKPGS